MRAAQIEEFGPPEVLRVRDLPDPAPGPGQVLVEVAAAGINFVETMIRSGLGPPAARARLPLVPGNEVGGRVVDVGEGVDPNLVGALVVSSTGGSGGYASLAVAGAAEVNRVPDGLDLERAVAVRSAGRTALALVRQAQIAPGDTVLVEAAAGGVGSLLVQLARNAGAATIIGAANGEQKVAAVTDNGADIAVDYAQPGWGDVIRDALGGAGVDVVFESVGGPVARTAFELLAPGSGRLVVFGFASGTPIDVTAREIIGKGLTLTSLGGPQFTDPAWLSGVVAEVLDLTSAGTLVPTIGHRLPLERAAEAHAAIEARTVIGKTLLIP